MLAAIQRAQELIGEGRSINAACKIAGMQFGVDYTTVYGWAKTLGQPLIQHLEAKNQTASARAARINYGKRRRGQVLTQLLDKADEILPDIVHPSELKDAAMAVAIIVDKARLEEGEATERTEQVDRRAALDVARAHLDKLRAVK